MASETIGSPFIETHDEQSLQLMAMTLVSMDPPKRMRMRKLVGARFTPRTIRTLHEAMEDRAARIIDAVFVRGR